MSSTIPEIKVLPNPAAVAAEAAERVAAADEAVELRDTFSLVLAGGSTPKKLYELLAAEPYRSDVAWPRVEVFFGDERAVPPDHADSNYRMARDALLSKVPIPGDNIYRIKGELDPPEEAAKQYGQMLKERFGDDGPDLVLLGMGEDGHTASIFPGTPAVAETKHRVVANHVEQSTTGKSWRITMTAPFINRARQVMLLVTGANKAARVAEVLEADIDAPPRYPVQLISPAGGRLVWLLDAAAAGMAE